MASLDLANEYVTFSGGTFTCIGKTTSGNGVKTLADALALDGAVSPATVGLSIHNDLAHVNGTATVTFGSGDTTIVFTSIENSSEADNTSLPNNWGSQAQVHN